MKKIIIFLFIILSFTFTGCMKKYQLDEEQTDMVAEYMAGLLLMSNDDYIGRLSRTDSWLEVDEQKAESKEEQKEEDSINKSKDKEKELHENLPVKPDTSKQKSKGENVNIDNIIGVSGLKLQYLGFEICDEYPKEEEVTYFSLEPREGYEFLVASFALENTSDETKSFDLTSMDLSYQLDVNVGTIYKPLLTLLKNDLQYFDITLKPGQSEKALLVFEISKDRDAANINLLISRENRSKIIEIK
jgi:hypothetical protein